MQADWRLMWLTAIRRAAISLSRVACGTRGEDPGEPDRCLALIDQGLAIARRDRKLICRPLPPSSARRNPVSSAIHQSRARGGSLPDRPRHRKGAGRAQLGVCARRLSLAKLYQSTGRPVDAHAILAPALEGFAPTRRDARDRGGAGAVGGYRGRRACEARINTAMGWLSCYSE